MCVADAAGTDENAGRRNESLSRMAKERQGQANDTKDKRGMSNPVFDGILFESDCTPQLSEKRLNGDTRVAGLPHGPHQAQVWLPRSATRLRHAFARAK